MKQSALSLTIGMILFGPYSPAFAIDDPNTDQNISQTGEPIPPYPEGEIAPPPYPEDGTAPYPYLEEGELPPPYVTDGTEPPPPNPEDGYVPPPDHYQEFGLNPDQFEHFNPDDIGQIDPSAFEILEPEDFARLHPEAMAGFSPEQFVHLDRDTIGSFSEHQFEQLPPELLAHMEPAKLGGFNPEIVGQFRPEHFQHFNHQQFDQADPRDIFKLISNSDPEFIKPEHVRDILPSGWHMDNNGFVELPEGELFTLPPVQLPEDLPFNVKLPDEIPNFNHGLGLGGQGEPIINGLNAALVHANLPQFDIKQDDQGIMQVTGSDEFTGTNLAFLPDFGQMKQGSKEVIPGVSQDERGLFVLTTPDGQVIPIRPVPKDVAAVKDLIPDNNGEVKLGKDGDVFLNIPEHDGTPPRCDVGIFDPFIQPAPKDLQPGIHFPEDPTGLIPATIVYEDGTSQIMNPTVPSPADFLEKAKEFEGVEDTQFNADGTIGLHYQNLPIRLKPTFLVDMQPLPANTKKIEPSIEIIDNKQLQYRYQQGDQIAVFTVNIEFQ